MEWLKMFSTKYTERHWEIVRDYLVRSYFEDVSMPSFSTTSEDEDTTNARSTSSGDLPPPAPIELPRISPLPELIIEKVNHDSLHDDSEEFYDDLEAKVNKLINNIQQSSQSDDFNDLDTIKLMDISQDTATEEENYDTSPYGHIRNVTYTIVNDLSTETEMKDDHSETHKENVKNINDSDKNKRYQTSQSANFNNKVTNLNKNEDIVVQPDNNCDKNTSERELTQKTTGSYQESITFTLEDNKKPILHKGCEYNLNERNVGSEPSEVLYPSGSAKTIISVHSVSKIHKSNLIHAIDTVYVLKSPILGSPVNNAENYNCSKTTNSEKSSSLNVTPHESLDSGSTLEESTDMERLETILEEDESQIKDTSERRTDDFEDGDATTGSESHNDSEQIINVSIPHDPEMMRATQRNSFGTTRFSFTPQDVDNELNIFVKPNITGKKYFEIHDKEEEIQEESTSNISLEEVVEVNTNADFVTSTPKSKIFNYSDHEINAAIPELVNKSQQCEIDCIPNNSRKRQANNTVNDEHSVSVEGSGNSKWEYLKKSFFIGVPKVYKLCNCKHHSCT